ncbi:phiRv1 phage protein [Mycobacterium xenopi]|uniref:PhiRv1 phage protein n=1 Tax=Mycobacterium xenopi TaxID=1789 RepID=A0AAD1H2L0_MYCXE|nr:hypothetical protein MYXE_30750 [Mycobacterium xenopi]SPX88933.1 phiRv1 phage protein [Mycobacterium xenopi]
MRPGKRLGPPERRNGPDATNAGTESGAGEGPGHPTANTKGSAWGRRHTVESRQVAWWSVHEFVVPILERVGDWPMAGTPAWIALADDDPRKWCALLDAARHWALRVETCQAALAEASHDVSAAADWPAIARSIRQRHDATRAGAYIPRRRGAA